MSADAFGAGGSDAQQTLQSFWPRVMEEIRNLTVVCYAQTHWSHTKLKSQWFNTAAKPSRALFCVHSTALIYFFQKDFRVQELPLARIKKIMKLDEDVKVRGQNGGRGIKS